MIHNIKKKILNLIHEGLFHIIVGNFIIKLISFVSSIIVVRLVIKSDYAHYAYAINLYSYIYLLSGIGLSISIVKFCSQEENNEKIASFLSFASIIGMLAQVLFAFILVVIVALSNIPFVESKILIFLMVFLPALTFLMEINLSFLRSQRLNKEYSYIAILNVALLLLFTVIFVNKIGIIGAILSQYLAYTVSISVSIIIKKKYKLHFKNSKITVNEKKELLRMGFTMMLANLFSMMMPLNELFLINQILKDEISTSSYKVASMIPAQIGFITGSISVFFFPVFANMKNKSNIKILAIKTGMFNLAIIIVIVLIGIIANTFIINLLYGQEYNNIVKLAALLWIANGVNAGLRIIPLNILPAIDKQKENAVITIIFTISHLILSFIFISRYGLGGAAYSSILIYGISSVFYWLPILSISRKVRA